MEYDLKFRYAISVVLKHEGFLSNDKNDIGGVTKYGISLRYLKAIGLDINKDGKIDQQDIFSLTKDKAIDIYYKNWWMKFNYYLLDSYEISTKIFDLAINMGATEAHKLLQKSINNLSENKINVDGILGPSTIKLSNDLDQKELHEEINNEAFYFYMDLVNLKPKLIKYLKGWLARAEW